jgi:hypothetical protein
LPKSSPLFLQNIGNTIKIKQRGDKNKQSYKQRCLKDFYFTEKAYHPQMRSETESPIPETDAIHFNVLADKNKSSQHTRPKRRRKHLKVLQSGSSVSSCPLLLPLVIGEHVCRS